MSPNSQSTNGAPQSQNGFKKNSSEKSPKLKMLNEKKFEVRDSVLTELFENVPHIATVLHVVIATLIWLFISVNFNDYLKTGKLSFGFYIIQHAFGKFHIAVLAWIFYNLVALLAFQVFNLWALVRLNLRPKSSYIKIWDRTWMGVLLLFYLSAFKISSSICVVFDLPQATAAIALLEQTRLTMKIHAFVRYNAEKVIKYKPHSDENLNWPKFSHYVYFLFAPTLVYRDSYPRVQRKINWSFVFICLLEIFGALIYQCFLIHRFFVPPYKEFGLRKFTWIEVLTPLAADNSLPGLMIMLSGFYQLLHSVQNFFAELLRFGDRKFYEAWWTSTSLSEYFRTWNIVVHDWLYTYVYRDVYLLTNGNKTIGKLTVFVLSAVVHEWVLTYLFKFFYPALIYCFFTAALTSIIRFPKARYMNVLFWYLLAFGSGLLCSLYTLEFFARTNTPDENPNGFKYYFIPRWLSCDCIV